MIGLGFTGSNLPLVKHLAKLGAIVDCYYVCNTSDNSLEAFDFPTAYRIPGMHALNMKPDSAIYQYMEGAKVSINIFSIIKRRRSLERVNFNLLPAINRFYLKSLCEEIKSQKYDVINVICHTDEIRVFTKELSGENVYFTFHEVLENHHSPPERINQNLDFVIRNGFRVIVHSKKAYEKTNNLTQIDNRKLSMIYFGQFETFSTFPIQPSKHQDYLLFFGHIHPYKGLDLLYDAAQIAYHDIPALKIIVAGNGIDQAVEKMKRDNKFFVINRLLSNSEIVSLIAGCRAVICPYKSSSQTGVTQVVSLFEKPIIATNGDAFIDTVRHDINGVIIEDISPTSIAKAMVAILRDDDYCGKLRSGMRRYSELFPQYQWTTIASNYIHLFKRDLHVDSE
jgi:glycosyltransferase involved in cell wall biosynthesis